MEKRLEKLCLAPRRQGAKVTGRGPSSRANARDLRKISPFGRNDKESFFPNLASLRLGGRNVRIRAFLAPGKFAHAAQIITDSSTRFSPDCAGEKRFALSANSRF